MEKRLQNMFDAMPLELKNQLDTIPILKEFISMVYKSGFMEAVEIVTDALKNNLPEFKNK